jgi:hypothetical protein
MSHDNKRAPADVPWRSAGIGMATARMCDTCRKPKSSAGGKVVRVLWACADCLAKRAAGKVAA